MLSKDLMLQREINIPFVTKQMQSYRVVPWRDSQRCSTSASDFESLHCLMQQLTMMKSFSKAGSCVENKAPLQTVPLLCMPLQVGSVEYDRQGIADHAINLASTIQLNLKRSLEAIGVVRY